MYRIRNTLLKAVILASLVVLPFFTVGATTVTTPSSETLIARHGGGHGDSGRRGGHQYGSSHRPGSSHSWHGNRGERGWDRGANWHRNYSYYNSFGGSPSYYYNRGSSYGYPYYYYDTYPYNYYDYSYPYNRTGSGLYFNIGI
jgi:hypothetical protein